MSRRVVALMSSMLSMATAVSIADAQDLPQPPPGIEPLPVDFFAGRY